jgi:hypothetical protein
MHCALGVPLNGRCWKNRTPEPICLAADTRIATPSGEIAVKDLVPGAIVWTLDASGRRVAAPVARAGHTRVARGHVMARVLLDDGRAVAASPGHPTCAAAAPGVATVADLARGARFGSATVERAERVPYGEPETFDVLPAGDTGCYWANGVLLGSTLADR